MASEAQILVARLADTVQIRILGRATFQVSQTLSEYGSRMLREGATCLLFEFSACEGMDSTFMGVLAMLGLDARGRARMVIVNASDQHRRLLGGIGVARLFTFAREATAATDWTTLCRAAADSVNVRDVAGTVLAAHETLLELDPANVPVFKDVVEYLRKDLGPTHPGNTGRPT